RRLPALIAYFRKDSFQIRVAGREIGPQDRTLPKAEHLHEKREADGDLLAGGPGRDMNLFAREFGSPVGCILGKRGCPGNASCAQSQSCNETLLPGSPRHRKILTSRCARAPRYPARLNLRNRLRREQTASDCSDRRF